MVKLIALVPLTYNGQSYAKGATFDATTADAANLVAQHQAQYANPQQEPGGRN